MTNDLFKDCGWNEAGVFCLYWNEDDPTKGFCEWCLKEKPNLPRHDQEEMRKYVEARK